MSFYIRFISTSSTPIDLETIRAALQSIDTDYALENVQGGTLAAADLVYAGEICGELEINVKGDDIFADEIDDLSVYLEEVDWSRADTQARVLDTLDAAQILVSVRVQQTGEDVEAKLDHMELLWDWLFEHYEGLLQIDGDGYYDAEQLVYDMNIGP